MECPAMNQAAVVPQFTYHQWPNQQPPTIHYKPRPLSHQLPSRHVTCPPGFSPSAPPIPLEYTVTAPLPFVWDPINSDYFCYEPETTCFVYSKVGRVYFDEVKQQHYRPDTPQRLNFARTYPEYRVYQSGEIMFYDPRRKDWYAYDLKHRRIVWRDQRWWPFPQKFGPPNLAGPSNTKAPKRPYQPSKSPTYRTPPLTAPKDKLAIKDTTDSSDEELIHVVEVKPDDASSIDLASSAHSGKSLKELHDLMDKRTQRENERARRRTSADVMILPDREDELYEIVPARPRSSKHRTHKAGIYDLEDLVANCKLWPCIRRVVYTC